MRFSNILGFSLIYGLAAKKLLSPALQAFLNRGEYMVSALLQQLRCYFALRRKIAHICVLCIWQARTEIVKALWEYIRAHDLQNPNNKRLDHSTKLSKTCELYVTMQRNQGAT